MNCPELQTSRRCSYGKGLHIRYVKGELYSYLPQLHRLCCLVDQYPRATTRRSKLYQPFDHFARRCEPEVLTVERGSLLHVASVNDDRTKR